MSHGFYILTAYLFTFGLSAIVTLVILLDGRARRRELKALEASGIRRRSARKDGAA